MLYFKEGPCPHSTLSAAILTLLLCGCSFGDEVADILATWQAREARIKSLHFECELEERSGLGHDDVVNVNDPDGVFAEDPPRHTRSLLQFTSDGTRMAQKTSILYDTAHLIHDGPAKRNKLKPWTKFQTVFTGKETRTAFSGGSHPTAKIEHTPKPPLQLTNGTNLIPIWMSHAPLQVLSNLLLEPKKMKLAGKKEVRDKREYVSLIVPRAKAPTHQGRILVDPKRGWSIVEYSLLIKGKVRRTISMRYEANQEIDWALHDWVSEEWTGRKGKEWIRRLVTGQVNKVEINQPVDKDAFEVEVTKGAHTKPAAK